MNESQLIEWRKATVERLVFENKLAVYDAIDQVCCLEKFLSEKDPIFVYVKNDEQRKALKELVESFKQE